MALKNFTVNFAMDATDVAAQLAETCTVEELIDIIREISDEVDDPDFDSRLYDLATENLDVAE